MIPIIKYRLNIPGLPSEYFHSLLGATTYGKDYTNSTVEMVLIIKDFTRA